MYMLVHSKIANFAYNFVGALVLWFSAFSLMLIGLEGPSGMGIGMVMVFGGPILLIITPFVLWLLQSLLFTAINKKQAIPHSTIFKICIVMLSAFLPLLLPLWYRTWYVPAVVAIIMLVWAVPPVWMRIKLEAETLKKKRLK